MKLEVSEKDIDRLIKSRVTEFNKIERDLKAKLVRRDNKIRKLQKELEKLKADMMITRGGPAVTIAKIAEALVTSLEDANFITRVHDCEHDDYCDCRDFY